MRRIDLLQVRKAFGQVVAVDGIDLSIAAGEQVAVLGPSGSGKSTLLRLIAGLEHPDFGDVHFDGESQLAVAAHQRDVALVFQQYALYPHLTALGNVTIGLRHGLGIGKHEAERRARDVARRLEIEPLLDRKPKEMSGGQRQRIALARALARQAGIVLLDEPLSGLDAQLRLTLRVEITSLLRRIGATVVHVTHDQGDAMTSADRVAVVNHGRIEQLGAPAELYDRPASLFVARFVGTPQMNTFPLAPAGAGTGRSPFGDHETVDDATVLAVRPESVRLDGEGPWHATATVEVVEHAGPERIVYLAVGEHTVALRTGGVAPQPGERVTLSTDPSAVHVFAGEAGTRQGFADQHARLLAPVH
jgi:multiple sugar transport system ATP-binding protein